MSSPIEQLRSLQLLAELPYPALAASARYWVRRELAPGEHLRTQGEAADGLGVVLSGTLVATAEGVELARLGPGELVGEVSALLVDSRASATLVAADPASLVTLSSRSLLGLRRQESPVYDALLGAALRTLSARVRATDARIAELFRDHPGRRSFTHRVESAPAAENPPALAPLLRLLPGLAAVASDVLGPLERAFTPAPMRRGESLIHEGAPAGAAWVVAAGAVQVRRGSAGDVELARLGPGDPFGFNALIDDGPRSASCVALSDGWLWRMGREDYEGLPTAARRAWQETLLATLATQLRIANALFSLPTSAHNPEFRSLLLAAGALEGLSGGESIAVEHPLAEVDPLRTPR